MFKIIQYSASKRQGKRWLLWKHYGRKVSQCTVCSLFPLSCLSKGSTGQAVDTTWNSAGCLVKNTKMFSSVWLSLNHTCRQQGQPRAPAVESHLLKMSLGRDLLSKVWQYGNRGILNTILKTRSF